MADIYFVARTDVAGDSGMQRSFGAFDDKETAFREVASISAHMQGKFEVFKGVKVSKED